MSDSVPMHEEGEMQVGKSTRTEEEWLEYYSGHFTDAVQIYRYVDTSVESNFAIADAMCCAGIPREWAELQTFQIKMQEEGILVTQKLGPPDTDVSMKARLSRVENLAELLKDTDILHHTGNAKSFRALLLLVGLSDEEIREIRKMYSLYSTDNALRPPTLEDYSSPPCSKNNSSYKHVSAHMFDMSKVDYDEDEVKQDRKDTPPHIWSCEGWVTRAVCIHRNTRTSFIPLMPAPCLPLIKILMAAGVCRELSNSLEYHTLFWEMQRWAEQKYGVPDTDASFTSKRKRAIVLYRLLSVEVESEPSGQAVWRERLMEWAGYTPTEIKEYFDLMDKIFDRFLEEEPPIGQRILFNVAKHQIASQSQNASSLQRTQTRTHDKAHSSASEVHGKSVAQDESAGERFLELHPEAISVAVDISRNVMTGRGYNFLDVDAMLCAGIPKVYATLPNFHRKMRYEYEIGVQKFGPPDAENSIDAHLERAENLTELLKYTNTLHHSGKRKTQRAIWRLAGFSEEDIKMGRCKGNRRESKRSRTTNSTDGKFGVDMSIQDEKFLNGHYLADIYPWNPQTASYDRVEEIPSLFYVKCQGGCKRRFFYRGENDCGVCHINACPRCAESSWKRCQRCQEWICSDHHNLGTCCEEVTTIPAHAAKNRNGK